MSTEQTTKKKGAMVQGVVVLTCICLAAGAGVGLLYMSMKDDIARKEEQTFLDVLAQVMPDGASPKEFGEYADDAKAEAKTYSAADGDRVVYAAMGQAKGYGGPIKVLASVRVDAPDTPVSSDPEILAVAVVSSTETPGLGENIKAVEQTQSIWAKLAGAGADETAVMRPAFQVQFGGVRLSELPAEKPKAGEKIQAVTGATITSMATVKAVRNAVQAIIDETGGQQ